MPLSVWQTYKSTSIRAIEAVDLDRRLGVGRGFGGFRVAASGGDGDARSCHAGSPGCDAGGEHCRSGVGGNWVDEVGESSLSM